MQHLHHRKKNKHVVIGTIMLLWLLSPLFLGIFTVYQGYKISNLQSEVDHVEIELRTVKDKVLAPMPTAEPTATPSATPVERVLPKKPSTGTSEAGSSATMSSKTWTGKVSHYSRAGCLGCSENLTMANGQPLDDDALTIAFNQAPLGTRLKLTNLDNGKSVIVTVTDTGGFERHGRIADLVPAVARALETKTDITNVFFETL